MPERPPPTSSACNVHSPRAYYQVMEWIGGSNEIEPSEWGWIVEKETLIALMTDKSPAPDVFLQMIHCNYSGGCKTLGVPADVPVLQKCLPFDMLFSTSNTTRNHFNAIILGLRGLWTCLVCVIYGKWVWFSCKVYVKLPPRLWDPDIIEGAWILAKFSFVSSSTYWYGRFHRLKSDLIRNDVLFQPLKTPLFINIWIGQIRITRL